MQIFSLTLITSPFLSDLLFLFELINLLFSSTANWLGFIFQVSGCCNLLYELSHQTCQYREDSASSNLLSIAIRDEAFYYILIFYEVQILSYRYYWIWIRRAAHARLPFWKPARQSWFAREISNSYRLDYIPIHRHRWFQVDFYKSPI